MTPEEQLRRALFVDTLMANIDNKKLSDSDFRNFVRNSCTQFTSVRKQASSDHQGPYGVGTPYGQ